MAPARATVTAGAPLVVTAAAAAATAMLAVSATAAAASAAARSTPMRAYASRQGLQRLVCASHVSNSASRRRSRRVTA